jgi:CheY-like chemotaxis protein
VTADDADVLLAEDDPADAELILTSLGSTGLTGRVHVARDGPEALDFVFSRVAAAGRSITVLPRLVLLDVKLPKITGLEVVRQIKLDPRTRPIPVVLLTSSNLDRDVALGYEYGANSYVQKPVDFGEFREAVQRLGAYWLTVNVPSPPRWSGGGRQR